MRVAHQLSAQQAGAVFSAKGEFEGEGPVLGLTGQIWATVSCD